MKRVLTAALLIPPVAYLILLGHPLLVVVSVSLVAVLCFREYCALVRAYGLGTGGPFGYVAGLVVLIVPGPQPLTLTLIALAALVVVLASTDLEKQLPSAASILLGIVYIFGPWLCALRLRDVSPHWLLFTLVSIWAGDIAAYYVGRAFGRHKMAPRLSPKKTWEGSLASIIAGAAVGGFYLPYFVPGVSVAAALVLAAVTNAAGQTGDLAESAIKRGAHVKDSSDLLPGHGGLLDRVDSTLFALPVVYLWVLRPWF